MNLTTAFKSMTQACNRKVFVQAGDLVGILGGADGRYRREGDALVVLPDERWGNPVSADACLDESDFHIHARLTLDRLTGTGASVLLGGHYHFSHSRPEGNFAFRICLDENRYPASKSCNKQMQIVQGMVHPRRSWFLADDTQEKKVVGTCLDYFRPGEPFAVDIFRRGDTLSFEINNREVFHVCLTDGSRLAMGRCGDKGWPISFGFMPGRGTLRIHEFWAEGSFPGPAFPTTDVWHFNFGGYTHYRIPSLCMTPGGRLLAFAEARHSRPSRTWEWEYDLVKDEVNCLMKYSDDNGLNWSEPQTVIDLGTCYEARDPSPLLDRETGEIFLFTRGGPWMISSRDEGRTWSEPRSLADAAPGEFKSFTPGTANSAIQLQHGPFRGRLLAALYERSIIGLIFSDDHGKTWQPGALIASNGVSEPSIAELSDGRVLVSPRGGRECGRLFLFSDDGGVTFSEKRYEPAIPMFSQGEILALEPVDVCGQGKVRPIICCGPAENKTRLTLMVSLDDGRTWPISRVIDDGSVANSAMVALPGGDVGVLYERDKYRRLTFQRVDMGTVLKS
jgi:sialidase-1